jgi:simple sugar transport system permease protein
LIIVFALALGITSVLIYISGFSPLEVYWGLLDGGFGSLHRIGLTLNETTPILLAGLGLILMFKGGVWNIGAEGQLYMGAVGAVVAGLFLTGIPGPLHLLLVAIASFIFGGIWGVIPAILKIKYKTNEIITSLMTVFIAWWFLVYAVRFPLHSPTAFIPVSDKIPFTARLPIILPGTPAHAGILIALGLAAVVWFILQKSTFGYRIKAIGINPDTAFYGGIPVGKVMITSGILGGGLAGLAGMAQVSGIHYLLADYLSANYGWLAILVVFIGRLEPFRTVLVAILLGGLLSGSHSVQMSLGIDVTVVHILVALIMLSLVLEPVIEKRLERLF